MQVDDEINEPQISNVILSNNCVNNYQHLQNLNHQNARLQREMGDGYFQRGYSGYYGPIPNPIVSVCYNYLRCHDRTHEEYYTENETRQSEWLSIFLLKELSKKLVDQSMNNFENGYYV